MSTREQQLAGSRAVLIGTPAYDDPGLPDVPTVANNVADLAAVLTDPDLGGFDPMHCVVAPARSDIGQIGDLLMDAAAEAEDLLLLYYSGHGLLGPLRRELYLSLARTKPDRLPFTALPFEAVRDACLASRARNRVVILDSCFSGRAIGETLTGTSEAVLGQIDVTGTYTLTSAPANRVALSLPGERHTAFTGRMLDLLRTGSASAGPFLSLGDIFRHLYAQHLAEGLPVPQQRGTATADLFGLVRNAAGQAVHADPAPAAQELVDEAEQDQFDVVVMSAGDDKAKVVKAVRELTRLSLEQAEVLIGTAPQVVLWKVDRAAAIAAKTSLENAGATVAVALLERIVHTRAEQDRFDVVMTDAGDDKIKVIKTVRELARLTLVEAKDLTHAAPQVVLREVDRAAAIAAKTSLEKAGATVTVALLKQSAPTWAEQERFDVVIMGAGENLIRVILAVRTLTQLGLPESRRLVDSAPQVVLREVDRAAAFAAKSSLEEVGASANVIVRG